MVLNAPNGEDLPTYYIGHPGYTGGCPQNNHTTWWRFTPYNRQETIYYLFKLIALPLVAAVIFIIIFQVGLGSFSNPIIQGISYILFYIASICLTSYLRELARAELYKVRLAHGLIDEKEDPNNDITFVAGAFTYHLNDIGPVEFRIGFVGDIMMMKKHELVFHNDIINFFNGVDIIVGNLEGIVNINGHTLTTQAHLLNILPRLQALLTGNTQWLLCLSNNHSIDFGNIEFQNSLDQINSSQISYVFGRNDVPNAYNQNPLNQNPLINITTATRWSNQHSWDCISLYEDINVHQGIRAHHLNTHFNILYPHWGYENERYVRTRIRLDATGLLTGIRQIYPIGSSGLITPDPGYCWDLIIGHHPHVRQAIMRVQASNTNNISLNRLVLFSGGNFTSGVNFLRARKHLFGTIMTCEIGHLMADPTQLAIGNIRWQRTVNVRSKPGGVKTKTVEIDIGDYPSSNTNTLIIAIVLITSIILVRILEMFFS